MVDWFPDTSALGLSGNWQIMSASVH
jgi:hypothetical protein